MGLNGCGCNIGGLSSTIALLLQAQSATLCNPSFRRKIGEQATATLKAFAVIAS